MPNAEFKALIAKIENNRDTVLDLSHKKIDGRQPIVLAQAIEKNGLITTIIFGTNKIVLYGVKVLTRALEKNKALQEKNRSSSTIGASAASVQKANEGDKGGQLIVRQQPVKLDKVLTDPEGPYIREQLLKAAALGDATAQFNYGLLFQNAQGVTQDLSTARSWFQKAAAQGHAGAQKALKAIMLQQSAATIAKMQERNKLLCKQYETLAAQGIPDAQFNLGILHEKGQGVVRDYRIAAEWYQKAAVQGHVGAQTQLKALIASQQSSKKVSEPERKEKSETREQKIARER